jgi:hypothetical protein
LTESLGFSFCINCNLYGYNCKHFHRIFPIIHSDTCSYQLFLGSDFLGLWMELSHTYSTVSSVMLGLCTPFSWWQTQPLTQNCSYCLQIDNTGGLCCPNCHWNAC